jgi:transcriptional regulator with XRE-family HTH domain
MSAIRCKPSTYQANAIQQACFSSGLTNKVIAQRAKVDRHTLKSWLSGNTFPNPDRLAELSAVLGVPVSYILTGGGLVPPAPPVTYINRKEGDSSEW